MDLHILPGVKAREVAQAHMQDVLLEEEHQCKCMTYWIDEARGNVFCLIQAPAKEVVEELHRKAHGLVPHRIIEVETSLVESFLGRVSDPDEISVLDMGLKVFHDPSYRIILRAKISSLPILQQKLRKEVAFELISQFKYIVRQELADHGGRETGHRGSGFIASFGLASNALACAIAVHEKMKAIEYPSGLRISLCGGEPVGKDAGIFGEAVGSTDRLCFIARDSRPVISSTVYDLISSESIAQSRDQIFYISANEEKFLSSLFNALETNWQEPGFLLDDYSHAMAMSKSQLYRKTVALTGMSPNNLVREYRLEKARELLERKDQTISEVCFNSGFTSPSYFTKCFKNRYGILPIAFLEGLMQPE